MKTTTLRALFILAAIGVLALVTIFVSESYSQSERHRFVAPDETNPEQARMARELLEEEFIKNPDAQTGYLLSVMPGPFGEPPDTTKTR